MDKFQKYNLNIGEKEKTLIKEYLEKIKKYVEENKIDKELFHDIEEMVFEKLSKEKKVDQLKIRKIIKEVGEPEVIFSDYVESKDSPKKEKKIIPENFYEKLIENEWTRDNKGAILLGISQTLAQKIGISTWAVRILLILLCFLGGLSAWVYILVGCILPVKGKNYSGKTVFGYFKTQLVYLVRDIVSNFSKFFVRALRYIFSNGVKIIKGIIENILPILRFFVFLVLSFCFAWLLLALIVVGAMYFSAFSIENIEYTGVLPNYFIWGILLGVISTSIFMVTSFLYGINKKIQSSTFLILAGVSFLGALFLGISTGFDLVKKYSVKTEFVQEAMVESVGAGEYVIDLSGIERGDSIGHFSNQTSIKVQTSTGDTIELKVLNKILGNDEISQRFKDGINDLVIEKSANIFSLKFENNTMFSKKVPFTFLEREITLYVPKTVTVLVSPTGRYYFENVFLNQKYEKYKDFLGGNCMGAKIRFSQGEDRFTCEANDEDFVYAQQEFFKRYTMENFDKLSSLKHKTKYKREYYNDYGVKSDWNFEELSFINNKTIKIQFSDMSLNVIGTVNAEEIYGGTLVSNFKIISVEKNDNYDEKYYEDVSMIKDFIVEEEGSEEKEGGE